MSEAEYGKQIAGGEQGHGHWGAVRCRRILIHSGGLCYYHQGMRANEGAPAMKQVKIGVGFGLWRLGMPPAETIARVAERAEDWGLDSFWLSDHLLAPSPELDVVATLSLLASRTSRMKLEPSVLLLNLRHPLMVANSVS